MNMPWRILLPIFGALSLVTAGLVPANSLYKVCHPILLPMDVLFLLDGSGSVSGNTFDMQMSMLRKVVELMRLEEKKSRLAVMQYAGYTRMEIQFGQNRTQEEVMDALRGIHYMSGSTKTGKALRKARDILKEEKLKTGNVHVKQVAIVVSDGHSHDDPMKQAAALRADGVSLVVLGIGHHINREELLQITGAEEHAFQNLHKEAELQNFVSSFGNISQEIECEFARKPRGATVTSNDEGFTITVSTSAPLEGALYVSGHFTDPKCISRSSKAIKEGDTTHHDTTLSVKYTDCGVQEVITETSQLYQTTVILQFDRLLATEGDLTYQIRASRDETSPEFKILEERISLSPPPCYYTVRSSGSCSSIQVNDVLTHSWRCNYAGDVTMSVHSCETVQPTSRETYKLLDGEGCPLSRFMSAVNQSTALLSSAQGHAVRFSSSPLVLFRCTLRLCKGSHCQTAPNCRKKREIEQGKRPAEEPEYEYNEEFPSAESRKQESVVPALPVTTQPSTVGRAIVKPLAIPATVFPGVDVLVNTKSLAVVVEGQKPAKELHEGLVASGDLPLTAEVSKISESPELIVFGRGGGQERIPLRATTEPIPEPASTFPTLVTETTTTPTTTTTEAPWEVDIVVETGPVLIRLQHESYITTCNKN